jgi:hypothetical protein
MILTQSLATSYARYRHRFLNGPPTVYFNQSGSPARCSLRPGVVVQENYQPVQFLRQANTNVDEPGAFLVADRLTVELLPTDPPDLPEEERVVKGIRHADQTLYASNAFLSLLAEYVITLDDETLERAENLLAVLVRLGRYQPGYRDESPSRCQPRTNRSYGYLLRHDAIDGEEEPFCDWLDDPESARFLEPSYDQLGTLNNCCAFAYKILTEPDVTRDRDCPSAHVARIEALKTGIVERMTTTHDYIAAKCRYFLRRCDGLPVDRGGGACWMYAYPLARTQAWVREAGADSYEQYDLYLETFVWGFLRDLVENLVTVVVDGLIDSLPGAIASVFDMNNKIQDELGDFGDFLDIVLEYFGDILEGIFVGALEALREAVRIFITSRVGDYLRNKIDNLPDTPISRALNEALAFALFEIFSRAVIVDPRSELDPRDTVNFRLNVGLLLQGFALPPRIQLEFRRQLSTPAVTATVLGVEVEIIPAQDFGELVLDGPDWNISVDWATLLHNVTLPVTVPLSLLGEIVFSNTDSAKFMTYHFFSANAAAHSFGETRIDPLAAARRFDNAYFMALLHRFYGAGLQRLSMLESAPQNFPKASGPRGWNQDFRWKREKANPGSETQLYNGVDFMVATMVAASRDAGANRERLRDAIETVRRGDDEQPGVVRLPFEGPYTGSPRVLWSATEGTNPDSQPMYLGVTFERRRPDGGLKLRLLFADGATENREFQQGDQAATAVQLPATLVRIEVLEIKPGTKGMVQIGV